ncbi:MAG TPA: fibronectin type III domain-containing protein [Thermoanaerobaculia bacterium]|nr:fibronectin type III domain-containing protein [Thermoanaerobaculia bacterium]
MNSTRRITTGAAIAALCWFVSLSPLSAAQPTLKPRATEGPVAPKTAASGLLSLGGPKAVGVPPCSATPITCGQTRSGTLNADDCFFEETDGSTSAVDVYTFQGTSGQTVTVSMTSSQVDSYLWLFDPLENDTQDDDGAGGNNARITQTLNRSGEWTIWANTAAGNQTGNYSITLACTGGGGGGVPSAPTNLQVVSTSSDEVDLSWTDNSSNETGFEVQIREGSGAFTSLGTVGANSAGATASGLDPGTTYSFRVRALGSGGNSAFSNTVTATTGTGPGNGFFTSPEFPNFRFRVRIVDPSGTTVAGRRETACLPDTVCVSGQLAGRSEVFIRIIGPRPNGFLWPTLVRFTPSRVEVDIQQISTGVTKTYILPAVPASSDELNGLQDREGFLP